MSCINVTNVQVLNNPTMFSTPLQFEVSFECISALSDDLEWKMIYVGSAESDAHDQELESVLVGPVELGINRFVFQGDPPDSSRIPANDLVGVTVVLLTCSYKDKEFIRIGYYVQNEWTNPAWNPPDGSPPEELLDGRPIDVSLVQRNILADKPRVTRFHIPWDDEPAQQQVQQVFQEGQQQMQMQMQQQQMQMQMQQQQMQMQMQPHQMAQMQQQQLAKPLMQDMNPQAAMLPQAMMQQAPKDFAGVPAGGMAWDGGVAGGMDVDL